VTIVGMSLAGLRGAETLRRLGFAGPIHVVGDEPHEPYDRPPLSKELLAGEWEPEQVALRANGLADLALDLHLGRRAEAFDATSRTVVLDDGRSITADAVVLTTGARARRLPAAICPPGLPNVRVLRTLDDALALRAALRRAPGRVAVIGAGFIGMEVAAAARGYGLDVTVVETLPQPMVRGLGDTIGAACAQLHRDRGVELRLGESVARVDERGIELAGGMRVDADVVVVGVGAAPNVEWLAGSGLELGDGVQCDETCRAAPGVYAAGDVACWANPLFDGDRMRLEHWTNAAEQAVHVAQQIATGEHLPFAPVPFVWSDQYDCKIQCVGRFDANCEMALAHGDAESGRFVALFGRRDRIVGAVGFSQPRLVMQYRRLIVERAAWTDALERAAG
jgi:NADPH-dependent 2,4-dienoyl-CoA reductase/sulfur reductase-like enzyme